MEIRLSPTSVDVAEFESARALPGGDAFVLECREQDGRVLRLRLPAAALRRLTIALPRVEAALHLCEGGMATAILAHPVVDWSAEPSGLDRDVALWLRTDEGIEAGYCFDLEAAAALHRELGHAITRSSDASLPPVPASPAAE